MQITTVQISHLDEARQFSQTLVTFAQEYTFSFQGAFYIFQFPYAPKRTIETYLAVMKSELGLEKISVKVS